MRLPDIALRSYTYTPTNGGEFLHRMGCVFPELRREVRVRDRVRSSDVAAEFCDFCATLPVVFWASARNLLYYKSARSAREERALQAVLVQFALEAYKQKNSISRRITLGSKHARSRNGLKKRVRAADIGNRFICSAKQIWECVRSDKWTGSLRWLNQPKERSARKSRLLIRRTNRSESRVQKRRGLSASARPLVDWSRSSSSFRMCLRIAVWLLWSCSTYRLISGV